MKKHFFNLPYMAAAAMMVFILSGCEKILPDNIPFDIERKITFNLQAAPPVGSVTLSDLAMSIDLDSALTAQGVDNYSISSIKPGKVTLETITDSTNLDALDSVAVFVTSSSLAETRIAHKYGIPKNIMQLPLEVSDVNVAEYLKARPTNFKVQAYIGDTIRKPMTMTMNVVFNVIAQKK